MGKIKPSGSSVLDTKYQLDGVGSLGWDSAAMNFKFNAS
jgi:hypothetical protein